MENFFESKTGLNFTLIDLLRWRALQQPERCAYKFLADGETLTSELSYGELDRQACAIATRLESLGASGDRVLLLYPPGLEFIAGFFGCLYAGSIAIPAYPPRPNRSMSRIQAIVADAQPTTILTTTAIFAELEQCLGRIPELKSLCWLESDRIARDRELLLSWQISPIDPNAVAYLQYTSGSTSSPKGIAIGHNNVLYNSACIKQAFELTADSISLSWLPHFHDMGLIDGIIQPLYSGYVGLLMPPVSFLQRPLRWLQAISRYKVTHSGGPNFAYELCANKITPAQRENLDLSSWHSAYNGAEPVRAATLARFTTAFAQCGFRSSFFYPCYGLAEATLLVAGGLIGDAPIECVVETTALENNQVVKLDPTTDRGQKGRKLIGCGRSWLDTKIAIVRPASQQQCKIDEVGEIWVSGTSVAQGYWQRPAQTQTTFQAYLADTGEGPFLRTGDLGFIQAGELFVTGRLKDLLIVRGRNHYPQDIELTVEQSHKALRSGCGAVVEILVDDEQQIVVIQEVERSCLRRLNVVEVANAIRQAVSQEHELQVDAIVLLKTGSIPKTSSGKIQRHACRTGFEIGTLAEVGRSEIERSSDLEIGAELSREDLLTLTPADARQQLLNYLQQQVARSLKIAPSQLDSHQPLSQLGLDSLMAIELKHYLETELRVTLDIADLLQDTNTARLAIDVLAKMQNSLLPPTAALVTRSTPSLEYPLSSGQMALWFLHQLNPQSSAYNTFFAARIRSEVDVVALRRAFQMVSDRHVAIQVNFTRSNGQPVQRVRQNSQVFFAEIDATNWSQDELNEQLAKSVDRAFDLEQELPLRIHLFRCGRAADILLVTAHHIAIDFWSLEVLLGEIGILYPQMKVGLPKLPELKWQYADYVSWQQDLLASDRGEQLWNYWQQQLDVKMPMLDLPTDRPRSPLQKHRGTVQTVRLPQDLVERIKLLTHTQGATLYMLLLAAFQVLLYRYTDREDLVVGSPAAGRNRAEFAQPIGYFVNPVALRVNLSQNPTFAEFLAQVKQVVLSALAHQDYPLSLLVQRLQPERDLSYSPLFQVMFGLEKSRRIEDLAPFCWGNSGARIDLGELQLESIAIEQRVALFDLTLTMLETEGGLVGAWQYDRDLFDDSTIARMAEHFQNLLAGIAANPGSHLQELPLIGAVEHQQLLVEWNYTHRKYPQNRCIHQLFETQVERTPNVVALVFERQQLTYRELNCRANQLAHYLRSIGVGAETLVGICLDRSIDMVVGMLGILKAGGAYVPLDPSYPQARLVSIWSDARLPVLLTSENLLAALPQHHATVVYFDRDWNSIRQARQDNPITNTQPANLAYILYTSGSTGQPKGVAIEHRSTVNLLHWAQETYTPAQLAGVLAATSINFDLSVFELFVPLCWGGRVILAENALHLPTLPAAGTVTLINTVPAVMAELLRINGIPAGVRTFNLAGEPLSHRLVQQLYQHHPNTQVFNLYGPTEATTYATFTLVPKEASTSIPIGRPLANTQVYILDTQLQPVPIGVSGELYIGGVGLAREYFQRPDLTAKEFIPHPFSDRVNTSNSMLSADRLYKTGDLARYSKNGQIEFLGRRDDRVKIRGFRIELGEIEAVLIQHPMVRQTVVVVRERAGERGLVAYLTPRQQPDAIDELRSFLKQKLPQYAIPSAFVSLDCLPLTPNDKIDRQALPNPEIQPQIAATQALPPTKTARLITAVWQELLHLENIDIDDNFFDIGGHSLLLVRVCSKLQDLFDREISIVDIFKYPTINDLTKYFDRQETVKVTSPRHKHHLDADIAIIGMSCRFPGAPNLETFWQNLRDGIESISVVTDRELRANGVNPTLINHPDYVSSRGRLPDIELFDADFFGISPQEAKTIDPQQRLCLEVAWEALENAGYSPQNFAGEIGVYAGIGTNTYLLNHFDRDSDLVDAVGEYQLMIGNDKDFLPTRISYKLNLTGPSVNVQTACSTSLVAVHLACQSLRNNECDMVLAGGVSIRVPQSVGYLYQEGMILSPDGHCRAFDANAQGTVPGNGLGVVVLKRLAAAIADGDCIQAIIKGSAINNDGSAKVSYTAPSIDRQSAVILAAQSNAGVDPSTISYIEAHGTGTVLGDPIEIMALTQAFQTSTQTKGFCAIGSVKTNIGHLDAAAGIAGLIKTVLALKHKLLPPSLNFERPNPQIDFTNSPFYVNTELREWQTIDSTRRAGVSAFGIGGTNAHIVLEEAAGEVPTSTGSDDLNQLENTIDRPKHLLTLSAKTERALEQLVLSYQDYLANQTETNLADICFTANVGRSHFEHRLALVVESVDRAHEQLAALANGSITNEICIDEIGKSQAPGIAGLFTGQGGQYAGMGEQLERTQPTFRAQLDLCQQILQPYIDKPLREILTTPSLLERTAYAQPALFALEYALYQLWRSWGIAPKTVMGHSLGEYVAACVAGVFSLADGLKLIAARGKLMQALPVGGKMVAVFADEEVVRAAMPTDSGDLAIAAINGLNHIVISGTAAATAEVVASLSARGIETKTLPVLHAFHSPLMQPMLAEFTQIAAQVTYSLPQLQLISNVTGELCTAEIATPAYWVRHIQQPVMFAAGMVTLNALSTDIYLEIGPKPTLLAMGRQCLPDTEGMWLPSLHPQQSDWQQLLESLGKLYVSGVNVDWVGFERGYDRRRVALPTYPFQRQRYWVDAATINLQPPAQIQTNIVNLLNQGNVEQLSHRLEQGNNFSPAQRASISDLLAELVKQHKEELTAASIENWFYHLEWEAQPRHVPTKFQPPQKLQPGTWLILADRLGVGQKLAQLLQGIGHSCLCVFAGNTDRAENITTWSIDPSRPDCWETLWQTTLSTLDRPLQGIVHLWSLDAAPPEDLTIAALDRSQILNCGSVLHLVQTLIKHPGSTISPRLWLATRGAVLVSPGENSIAVAQSSVWGLGKVIALEHPQLWGGTIDLDPEDRLDNTAMRLLEEIETAAGEDHLAIRGEQSYVARLKPSPVPATAKIQLRADWSYLITGGLGALGLKVAKWMVGQGAKQLVLSSRHQGSIEAQETLRQFDRAGVKILVVRADVSQPEEMVQLFAEIETKMSPLRGIIHAAGVLNDGTLHSQNWERFAQTLAPKVRGSWNLHILTKQLPLDFLIFFSSAASLLGSPGQGSYAAANAFMDTLAHYRQQLGLAGLSINWGQWSETGMSADLSDRHQAQLTDRGFSPIDTDRGLQVLESLLGSTNLAQIGVFPVNWSLFPHPLPLLAEPLDASSLPEIGKQPLKQHELLLAWDKIPPSDRQNILIDRIQTQVVQILKLNPAEFKLERGFADLGMDSLMAIELRNRLEKSLNISLPLALVFEYPTVKQLANYIATNIFNWQQNLSQNLPITEDRSSEFLATIEQLNEAEVQAAIAQEMAELERLIKGECT